MGAFTLITLDGGKIKIEYPKSLADDEDFCTEIRERIETGKLLDIGNWNGVCATFNGIILETINTKIVVGY